MSIANGIAMNFVQTVFWVAALAAAAPYQCKEVDQVVVLPAEDLKNISYAADARNIMDLYLPEGRSTDKTPVFVFVHGGGWIAGDKSQVDGLVKLFKAEFPKAAIANINYRLAVYGQKTAFPEQTDDVESALDFLKKNSEKYNVDDRFILVGVSAGAHLAMLTAYDENLRHEVLSVVNIVGPTDFTDPFYTSEAGFEWAFRAVVDPTKYNGVANLREHLSPAYRVNENSPPTISFYGSSDRLVAVSQLERLNVSLAQKNIRHDFKIFDGGHGNWTSEQYQELRKMAGIFVKQTPGFVGESIK